MVATGALMLWTADQVLICPYFGGGVRVIGILQLTINSGRFLETDLNCKERFQLNNSVSALPSSSHVLIFAIAMHTQKSGEDGIWIS